MGIDRICKQCNQFKPLSEFKKRKNGKYGRQSRCKSCLNEYSRNQRKQKPEQYRKYDLIAKEKPERQAWEKLYNKKYYWTNKEKMLAVSKKWIKEHPDKAQENLNRLNRWNKDHPEKQKEASRKCYLNNIERFKIEHKQYRQNHPIKNRQYANRHRARKNAAFIINFNEKELDQRLSMFGYKCWICWKLYEAIDHVKPLSKGGLHILSNLRPICKSCNSKKRDKWPFSKEMIYERNAA